MAKHPLTDAGIGNKRRKPGLAHGECGSFGCFVKGFIMNDLELKKVAVDFPGRYGHRKPTKPVNTETACIITETCWEFS